VTYTDFMANGRGCGHFRYVALTEAGYGYMYGHSRGYGANVAARSAGASAGYNYGVYGHGYGVPYAYAIHAVPFVRCTTKA
jgi:hypothetical protein